MARRVAEAPTEDFAQLVRIAGLDPCKELRFGDFSGVCFRQADLRGFDFTGAKLHACDFSGALIEGARFDTAEIAAVKLPPSGDATYSTIHSRLRSHIPSKGDALMLDVGPLTRRSTGSVRRFAGEFQEYAHRLPHDLQSGIANLTEAGDWEAHAKSWRRQAPQQQPTDHHLRPGAIFQDAPFAPELVVVPAGTITTIMGRGTERHIVALTGSLGRSDPRTDQPRQITISRPFAVGRFTVKKREWDAARAHPEWEQHSQSEKRHRELGRAQGELTFEEGEHIPGIVDEPVTVEAGEAASYVRWLAAVTGKPYRLLSHAKWDYCTRAGLGPLERHDHTYENLFRKGDVYCSEGNELRLHHSRLRSELFARSRGTKVQHQYERAEDAHAWGIHGLQGLTWEWCRGRGDSDVRAVSGGSMAAGSFSYDPGSLAPFSYDLFPYDTDPHDVPLAFRVARMLA